MATTSGQAPLISILISARNDNYMGDFKWRLQTSLNSIAVNAASIGRPDAVEAVVCDWGSDVPLHKAIRLRPEAAAVTRFVVIPPDLARRLKPDGTISNPLAYNAAARRSTGQFLGQTGGDILYPAASLMALFAVLEGKIPGVRPHPAAMVIGRRQIPVHIIQRQLSLRALHGYVDRNATFLPLDQGGVATAHPTNMILLSRELWFETHGIDERFPHWGWNDIDQVLRISQKYPVVHLDHFGVNLIHMEHWTKPRDYDPKTMFMEVNQPDDNPGHIANDPDWGLGREDLKTYAVENVGADDEAEIGAGPSAVGAVSLQQFQTELQSDGLREPIAAMLKQFNMQMTPTEMFCLYCLGWYSARFHPVNYVEAGFRYAHAAAAVAKFTPGVEVYGLLSFERRPEDEAVFSTSKGSLMYFANNLLRLSQRHWAYSRFIGGDRATQVQRLRESCAPLSIDLAFVRGGPHATDQARELAGMLAANGAMVVLAPNPENFQSIWSALSAAYPSFEYLSFSDSLGGMVLATRLAR